MEPDLNRPFELVKLLGRTSSATVHLAVQNNLPFAFKIASGDQGQWRAAQPLRHDCIARTYDEGTSACGKRGLIMEYVDGPTLLDVLKDRPGNRLEPRELWTMAEQLAAGLDYASDQRVLHRDLKPGNVMLRRWDWQVKIVDFGSACPTGPDGSIADNSLRPGTLLYMPPEVISREERWRRRGDVYSFAAILYECLEGQSHLFRPRNDIALEEMVQTVQKYALFAPTRIPRQPWHVLRQSLSRNPGERSQSATDLVRELRASWGKAVTAVALPDAPAAPSGEGWKPHIRHHRDGAEMVYIPAGTFRMGHDTEGEADNRPAHEVHLSGYYVDAFPVTNARFAVFARQHKEPLRGRWAAFYEEGENDEHPVRGVAYEDCEAYCKWAKKQLPTEAQWERAARAGCKPDEGLYPWGDTFTDGLIHCGADGPVAVGMYSACPGFDLFDFAGNVAEWVRDWYSSSIYTEHAGLSRPPKNPCMPGGLVRLLRGGHWDSKPEEATLILRRKVAPDYVGEEVGFRTIWVPTAVGGGV
jgi:formylglycine-generating enzyme required for sulfatase activity